MKKEGATWRGGEGESASMKQRVSETLKRRREEGGT